MSWDLRQARLSLLLFLTIVIAGLVKASLTRPVYPDPDVHNSQWPLQGCLIDATALKNRALEVFPRGTTISRAIRQLDLDVDPLGSGFCLPRAGVLQRGKNGWRVRAMTQEERWVWRIPMDVYRVMPEDLSRVRGIGPALGGRIYRYLKERRCLESLDDLLEVPGIGPGRLKALKEEMELN